MSHQKETPRAFPVRRVEGRGWGVLVVPEDKWLGCETQADADAIAAAPVLECEALEKVRSGEGFAAELERTADALEKYRMGFGTRFFRWAAQQAREGQE